MLTQKPIVVKKILSYIKKCTKAQKNNAIRGFQISYKSICNFRCSHCYVSCSSSSLPDSLTIDDVKRISNEFNDLNAWEVGIQGGEPLLFPDLPELIEAIDSSRFYVCIITNGYLMTEKKADELARLGVDRVAVSIDGFSAESHDFIRNKPGSFSRCLTALEHIKNAGMTPTINMVIGHYNAKSDEFIKFLSLAEEKNYQIVINPATPTGHWRGNLDVILTDDDSKYLLNLRKNHPSIMRDCWNFSKSDATEIWGDPAGNLFYISSHGSIFPHPYIFISLGNVGSISISDAAKKAWKVKYFRDKSLKSLAGEDVDFINRFLVNEMSVENPLVFEKVFVSEDFYATGEEEILNSSRGCD